jgi:hypothetical protein
MIRDAIETVAQGIEALAVVIILVAIVVAIEGHWPWRASAETNTRSPATERTNG